MQINKKKEDNQIKDISSENKKEDIHLTANILTTNESIDFKIIKNVPYNISLKIYQCIFAYFHFRKTLESYFKNKLIYNKYFYLIDEFWLNNFKNLCNYNLIERTIKIQDTIQGYIKNINDFTKKYPLNCEILKNIPKESKIIKYINEQYCDNYEFIDNSTMRYFKEVFNFNNIKKFTLYEVMIKDNIIILKYNEFNLEITILENMIKKQRLLFTVNESKDIQIYLNLTTLMKL